MGYLPYKRGARLSNLFKEEICRILMTEVKDPRLTSLTITSVKVTDDLTKAEVWYYVREENQRKNVERGLKSASSFIRRKLFKNLRIRKVPALSFKHNDLFVEVGLEVKKESSND